MRNSDALSGLGKVYKFTLVQLYKNKSNLISFGIFILIALASVPVMSIFMGDNGGTAEASFYTSVYDMESFMERDSVGFDARYFVQYGYSLFAMMMVLFSATFIVRAVLEEKSSKLVETLRVSIKSEAMIMGKQLAIITFVLSMLLLIIAGFAVSYFASGLFIDTSFVGNTLTNVGITKDVLNIGFGLVAVTFVSLLLACVLLSQIAALSGAGCSSMEDMESANMTATMLVLVCYMITVIASPINSEPSMILALCPFLSSFAMPTYYAMGQIGFGVVAASWALQIVVILALYKLSGKVYDSLIMHNGKRIKMSKILAMGLKGKGETKNEKE